MQNVRLTTNNYIESWHRVLKKIYLGSRRRRRIDVVIYILTSGVEADFKADILKANLKTGGRMTVREQHIQSRKHAAMQATYLEHVDQVVMTSVDSWRVMSFTNEDKWYEVQLDEDGNLASCTCDDWMVHRLPCKHMWLTNRFENIPVANSNDEENLTGRGPQLHIGLGLEETEREDNGVNNLNTHIGLLIRRVGRKWDLIKEQQNSSVSIRESIRDQLDNVLKDIERLDSRRAFIPQ